MSQTNTVSGVPRLINKDIARKPISKMKNGESAGPLSLVSKMLKTAGDSGVNMIRDLVNQITLGVIHAEWQFTTIVNYYKGKGDPLERGNYRGLKITDHILKIAERIIEKLIKQQVNIDEMQFGFMPGCGAINAIFILRQLQENLAKKEELYVAFVDLRTLGVEEWFSKLILRCIGMLEVI